MLETLLYLLLFGDPRVVPLGPARRRRSALASEVASVTSDLRPAYGVAATHV